MSALFALLRPLRADTVGPAVPPGDLVVVYASIIQGLRRGGRPLARRIAPADRMRATLAAAIPSGWIRSALGHASRLEASLGELGVIGGLFAALLAAGLLLAWR